ncbi:33895_t:CDS:2, partial [Racocetra persica]
MSDLSLNPNWFHSNLLKTFVLNILKNSKDVKICGINIEHTDLNCPKCPVQSEGHLEEIEITPKHKKNTKQFKDSQKIKKLVNKLLNEVTATQSHQELTAQNTTQSHHESNTILAINFNDLNKEILIAEENNNKSIHEVLKCYYILGEAIAQSFEAFYNISHDISNSKQQVNQEFKRQLNIDTLDIALRKRKEQSEKIYSLFSCFNTNDNKSIGKEMIVWVRSFSLSTISNLSWDNINIVKEYIT